MSELSPRRELPTHTVTNQPTGVAPPHLWDDNQLLRHWLKMAEGLTEPVRVYANELSRSDLRDAGRLANQHQPELNIFDRFGARIDEVNYHPAYHRQLAEGVSAGYSAVAWEGTQGGHAAHAAMVYLLSQIDPGVCCPLTMTYAGIAALRGQGSKAEFWAQHLTSRTYDPSVQPLSAKLGATLGMAMTEKQGGSDVRANSTRADREGDDWRLTGHKWFCSAPMSDGFLTLAQSDAGLSCFLVPRWMEDGSRNGIQLMRLKDKLGNRSNASAEIEYNGAWAQLVGEPGDGVRAIIRMVHHTRLDTAMAPAGLMHAALFEALGWCRDRNAFGKPLIEQPLMIQVLADLALDVEAALALGLWIARAFDQRAPLERIGVALAKYLSNKLAPAAIYEAMEALGGMGYVEETPLPLLYREAPLNSIWEGSGNVICLDVLRTLGRDADSRDALDAELSAGEGMDTNFDNALSDFRSRWSEAPVEAEGRAFTETAATLLAASVLLRMGEGEIGAHYCFARLRSKATRTYGTSGLDAPTILARHL